MKEQHVLLCQVTHGLSSCSSKQNNFLWATEPQAAPAQGAGERFVIEEP